MISKASSVYVVMLALFGVGLWAIVSFGSILLHAPTDLSGKWELHPFDSRESTAVHQMSIDQSGKFFQIVVDGRRFSPKQSRQEHISNPTRPDQVEIALTGDESELLFSGPLDSEEYQLRTRGVVNGNWHAVRVVRTYPKRAADQPPPKPAVATSRP